MESCTVLLGKLSTYLLETDMSSRNGAGFLRAGSHKVDMSLPIQNILFLECFRGPDIVLLTHNLPRPSVAMDSARNLERSIR